MATKERLISLIGQSARPSDIELLLPDDGPFDFSYLDLGSDLSQQYHVEDLTGGYELILRMVESKPFF